MVKNCNCNWCLIFWSEPLVMPRFQNLGLRVVLSWCLFLDLRWGSVVFIKKISGAYIKNKFLFTQSLFLPFLSNRRPSTHTKTFWPLPTPLLEIKNCRPITNKQPQENLILGRIFKMFHMHLGIFCKQKYAYFDNLNEISLVGRTVFYLLPTILSNIFTKNFLPPPPPLH